MLTTPIIEYVSVWLSGSVSLKPDWREGENLKDRERERERNTKRNRERDKHTHTRTVPYRSIWFHAIIPHIALLSSHACDFCFLAILTPWKLLYLDLYY